MSDTNIEYIKPYAKDEPNPSRSAMSFQIGDRTYFVSRDDRRNGYRIVANGDVVDFASALHYGEVVAFRIIAQRLEEIEDMWLKSQNTAPSGT